MNNYLTHGIHPYHAKYIPEVPRTFIEKYSKEGDLVLDPFAGSGTTLLEAFLLNRNSIGVDLSFLAAKISLAKISIVKPSLLQDEFVRIQNLYQALDEYPKVEFENKSYWYNQKTIDVLDRLFYAISTISDQRVKNIFEVIFSSILKTVSNKRKVWNNGYIADNVLPNVSYSGDAYKVFVAKAKTVLSRLEKLYEKSKSMDNCYSSVVHSNILDFNIDEKVDLIVTSPPYPFAVDFAKYYRLSYYWFSEDVIKNAEEETGSRHKRNRASAVDDFFKEMKIIYEHLFSLVKHGGYFCMTVADTSRKNNKISFITWLKEVFQSNGWILIEDSVREIQNQSMAQKRIPNEHMLTFQKK